MTKKYISVEDLKKRLKKQGKKSKDVQQLLKKRSEITEMKLSPDRAAISNILKKNEANAELKVKGFKLSREQYDALLNYFKETHTGSLDSLDGDTLVHKAIKEFMG